MGIALSALFCVRSAVISASYAELAAPTRAPAARRSCRPASRLLCATGTQGAMVCGMTSFRLVPRADTAGAAWLLQHGRAARGLPLLPDELAACRAAQHISRQDSGRRGRHGQDAPISLDVAELDVAAPTGQPDSMDVDLVAMVRAELGSIAQLLELGKSQGEIAAELGVCRATINRKIQAVKNSMLQRAELGALASGGS